MSRPTIQTAGGQYFDFEQPERSYFDIDVLAHALSNLCRFTGHTRRFYSVAQHSVIVNHVVPPQFALPGLMHDAAEGLVGDMSSPLKQLLPGYKEIEARVERPLLAQFGLWPPDPWKAEVKKADLVVQRTEQRDLMPPRGDDAEWTHLDDVEPLPFVIEPLAPELARRLFLQRFQALGGMR